MSTMLALRLHPDGSLRLADEPLPEPGPGEALIRVTAVGLCGSDRHWALEGGIGGAVVDRPLILGHEFAGIVETGELRGRLVAVDPAVPCEDCEPCLAGRPNLCLHERFAGHSVTDGALREWIAWPERCLVPLSDRFDGPLAALVEPAAVAVHAFDLVCPGAFGTGQADRSGDLAGASVAVLGCGPIGLMLVDLARAAGAEAVIATDPLAHRRDAARALGATGTLEATPDGAERAAALDATKGRGFDLVLDAAGGPDAIDTAIAIARPAADVVLVGIPSVDRTSFVASIARRKELTIRVSHRSTLDAFRRAAGFVERRAGELGSLISLRVPLADAQRGFDALFDRSGIKVIVEPGPR